MIIRLYTQESIDGPIATSIIEAQCIKYNHKLEKIEILAGNDRYISTNKISKDDYIKEANKLSLSSTYIELVLFQDNLLHTVYLRNIL